MKKTIILLVLLGSAAGISAMEESCKKNKLQLNKAELHHLNFRLFIRIIENAPIKEIEDLFKKGAQIDAQDAFGLCPLHRAAEAGHYEIVEYLIKRGASLGRPVDTNNVTPLHYAAHEGHLAICKLLLDNGADVNAHRYYAGTDVLSWACSPGNLEVFTFLLGKGARIVNLENDGFGGLTRAALCGYIAICRLLLTKPVIFPSKPYDFKRIKERVKTFFMAAKKAGYHKNLIVPMLEKYALMEDFYAVLIESFKQGKLRKRPEFLALLARRIFSHTYDQLLDIAKKTSKKIEENTTIALDKLDNARVLIDPKTFEKNFKDEIEKSVYAKFGLKPPAKKTN